MPIDPSARVSSRVISTRKVSYAIASIYLLSGFIPHAAKRASTAALERRPRAAQGVFGKALGDDVVGLVERIGTMEEIEVTWADRAIFNERAQIDHLIPIFSAKEHDRHALACLARLYQGQYLKQLVERAKAAWEQHNRLS